MKQSEHPYKETIAHMLSGLSFTHRIAFPIYNTLLPKPFFHVYLCRTTLP